MTSRNFGYILSTLHPFSPSSRFLQDVLPILGLNISNFWLFYGLKNWKNQTLNNEVKLMVWTSVNFDLKKQFFNFSFMIYLECLS